MKIHSVVHPRRGLW